LNAIFRYGNSYNLNANGGIVTIDFSTFASSSNIGLYIAGGTSTITNSQFRNNSEGLKLGAGVFHVSSSTFAGNSTWGVDNAIFPLATSSAIAKNNYWNASSGPHNAHLNASGTGDNVTDFVDFVPWLMTGP